MKTRVSRKDCYRKVTANNHMPPQRNWLFRWLALASTLVVLLPALQVHGATYDFFPVAITGSKTATFTSTNGNGVIYATTDGTLPISGNNVAATSQFTNLFQPSGPVPGWQTRYDNNAVYSNVFDLTAFTLSSNTVFGMWNITQETNTYLLQLFAGNTQIAPPFNWNFIGYDDNVWPPDVLISGFHMNLDFNTGIFNPTNYPASGPKIDCDGAFWNKIPTNATKMVLTGHLNSTNMDGVVFYFAEPREPCSIVCPQDIVVTICGSATNVVFPLPALHGLCFSNGVANTDPANGSAFPLGTNNVHATVPGYTNTCDFKVIVLNSDTNPPIITCPSDLTVLTCGSNVVVNYTVTATDNSGIVTTNCTPPSGSSFPLGTNVVSCVAIDGCSNASLCSFHIIVKTNPTPWGIICNEGISVNVTGCPPIMPVLTNVVTITNACPIPGGLTIVQSPPPGSQMQIGPNGVLLTICETNGTHCQYCSFNASGVPTDNIAPTINCPKDIVVFTCGTNAVANYVIGATDNLGVVATNCSPPSGSTFPMGSNQVVCTAIDACSNMATCSFYVIVKPYPSANFSWNNPSASYYGGVPDLFFLPAETATLGPCIPSVFAATWKGFDATNNARPLGHRFSGLPNNILKAFLTLRMKPGTAASSSNDKVYMGFNSSCNLVGSISNCLISSLPGTGGTWQNGFNGPTTFNLDLPTLIPKFATNNFLDVIVHDDTVVDFMQLRVWTCPPPFTGTGLPNNPVTNIFKGAILTGVQLGGIGTIGNGTALSFQPANPAAPATVEVATGGGRSFAFTTILYPGAPIGAQIVVSEPSDGGTNNPLVTLARDNRGWDMKVTHASFADSGDFRVSAVNESGDILDSFVQTPTQESTNPPLAFLPGPSTTAIPVTIRLDADTGNVTVSMPGNVTYRYCRECPTKGWDGIVEGSGDGWDGTIKGRSAHGSLILFTPTGTYHPATRTSLLITSTGLNEMLLSTERLVTDGREVSAAGSSSSVLFQSTAAGDGVSWTSLTDYSGISIDLGRSQSFELGSYQLPPDPYPFQQTFRIIGPGNPLILTNRPAPPTNYLRFAGGGPILPNCSVDFSEWGGSNVTIQLYNNGVFVGQSTGVPASLANPMLYMDRFPGILGCPGVGVLRLSDHEPFNIYYGVDCGPGGCVGNELLIIPELPVGAPPPIEYFSEVQSIASENFDGLLYNLQRVPYCAPASLNVSSAPGGTTLSWSGNGYRLQGAESLSGPWLDLGLSSPVILHPDSPQRFFRLMCE